MVRQIERTAEERVRDRELSVGPRGVRDYHCHVFLLRRHNQARDDQLMGTVSATRIWMDEILFASCQLVSGCSNFRRTQLLYESLLGGGKSLTYQPPATLVPGCTLVVSPLVSLMRDQILHLRENSSQ